MEGILSIAVIFLGLYAVVSITSNGQPPIEFVTDDFRHRLSFLLIGSAHGSAFFLTVIVTCLRMTPRVRRR